MSPSDFLLSSEFFDFILYTKAVAFDCTASNNFASADVLGGQAAVRPVVQVRPNSLVVEDAKSSLIDIREIPSDSE